VIKPLRDSDKKSTHVCVSVLAARWRERVGAADEEVLVLRWGDHTDVVLALVLEKRTKDISQTPCVAKQFRDLALFTTLRQVSINDS
jgi:hypothetical protein